MSSEVRVEGVVSEFRLVNPHSYIYFSVENEEGVVEPWRCEMAGGTPLRRAGLTDDTFTPGEAIVLTGNPALREDRVCYMQEIELQSGVRVDRAGGTSHQTSEPLAEEFAQSVKLTYRDIDPERGLYDHWVALRIPGSMGRPSLAASDIDGIERSTLPLPTPVPDVVHTAVGLQASDAFEFAFDMPALRCESNIIGGMYHNSLPNKFELVESDLLKITTGYMDLERLIYLDGVHPENPQRSLLGHSIGRWEGETLVVDTVGIRQTALFPAPNDAVMNSDQLHIVERFTIDPDFDHLVVEYWAEDPLYWESPIRGVYRLVRSPIAYERYECVELSGQNNLQSP